MDTIERGEIELLNSAPRDCDKVEVAHARVVTAHNDRAVQVQADQIIAKETSKVISQRDENRPQGRVV